MKLPEGCPFVILDFVHTDKPMARITEDFVDWIVRDCAELCRMIAAQYSRGNGHAAERAANLILARYGMEE